MSCCAACDLAHLLVDVKLLLGVVVAIGVAELICRLFSARRCD